MIKCIVCEGEAKWKSTKYLSPLCSRCARKEVDKIISESNDIVENLSTKDFYEYININFTSAGSTHNRVTGELIKLSKEEAIK